MPTPISLPKGYQRLGDFPLDASSVFDNFTALQTYSQGGTAYAGQIVAVKDTGIVYIIRTDKSLSQVGSSGVGEITGLSEILATKADLVAGKIPAEQLPGFVDDVQEFGSLSLFPNPGESGKIYIALDSLKTYRWGGSVYAEISSSAVTSVAGKTGAVQLEVGDVDGLQTALSKKQTKTVYSDQNPAHEEGLEWVDTKEFRSYRSFSGHWIEVASP